MAKTPNAPLGPASGKLGNIVYASWKGINYARQYVIPANPQTTSQTTVRSTFANVTRLAQSLLGAILQPFWDPFVKKTSGYADFLGRTMKASPTFLDPTKVEITRGSLEPALIASAVYASDTVTITWDGSVLSNGSPTDVPVCFVYDIVNKVGFATTVGERADETADVTVGSGRSAINLQAYLGFVDSASAPTVVANSDHAQVTA